MSEQNQATEITTESAAPEVKKTRLEKLTDTYTKKRAQFDKLSAELTEIVAEINGIQALANVQVGTKVVISVGKGESAKEVEGTVVGIREDEEGAKQYKVAYGVGFDADVKVVGASKLKLATVAETQPE